MISAGQDDANFASEASSLCLPSPDLVAFEMKKSVFCYSNIGVEVGMLAVI